MLTKFIFVYFLVFSCNFIKSFVNINPDCFGVCMIDLSTKYLGLNLKNPVIVSSCGLTNNIKSIKKIEDAGAGCIVMKSLFEEQIIAESGSFHNDYNDHPEAVDLISNVVRDNTLDNYINLIKEIKKTISIPVIASLNCVSSGEWISFAKKIEAAGADALELNIFIIPSLQKTSQEIEDEYIKIVASIKAIIKIPLTVKIGCHFTNLYKFIQRLFINGANGVVLFNRFFQPDIDLDTFKLTFTSPLTAKEEFFNVLRWSALLTPRFEDLYFSASTGVYSHEDVIKAMLVGNDVVQIASTVYKNGFQQITTILNGIKNWMSENNYENMSQIRGILNQSNIDNASFDRFQYIKTLFETSHNFNLDF